MGSTVSPPWRRIPEAGPPVAAITATVTAHQIGRHGWQSIVLTSRPTLLDNDVLALDKSRFFEALEERGDHCSSVTLLSNPITGIGLLRARRERPRRRAAEQRNELAPPCMSGKEHCEG